MTIYLRTFFVAMLAIGSPIRVQAEVPVDTLPCDAWLTTIASGVTSLPDFQALYRIDGCKRPDSVVVAAREAGTRSLLARNEIGAASLYLDYLERDSVWFANAFVPFVLPIVTDKSKSTVMRGQMMFLIAASLQLHDTPVGSVYVVTAGTTPGTSARCTQGSIVADRPEKTFLPASITTIKTAAQAMIDDSTEVPQLREAAKCLLDAANNPDR